MYKRDLDELLDVEPSFEEYCIARRVVLYEYNQLRDSEKYRGALSVARDEMLGRIIYKSCERFRGTPENQFEDITVDE